jgi:hypothetical protein
VIAAEDAIHRPSSVVTLTLNPAMAVTSKPANEKQSGKEYL